jgi:hypothetical protein
MACRLPIGLGSSLKYPCVNVAFKPADCSTTGDYLEGFGEYALRNKIKQLGAADLKFLANMCVSNDLNVADICCSVLMCLHWSSCVLSDPVRPM